MQWPSPRLCKASATPLRWGRSKPTAHEAFDRIAARLGIGPPPAALGRLAHKTLAALLIATTDGVRAPSWLRITTGSPPCITTTTEFVVPEIDSNNLAHKDCNPPPACAPSQECGMKLAILGLSAGLAPGSVGVERRPVRPAGQPDVIASSHCSFGPGNYRHPLPRL